MPNIIKLLLRVIMHRIRSKLPPEIDEGQYGFMPDEGTRNAIFTLQNIGQRVMEVQKDLYLCSSIIKKH